MNQLETWLNTYLGEKAPQLPLGFKNFIVAAVPYLAAISLFLGVFTLLPMIGIMFGLSGMMFGGKMVFGPNIAVVAAILLAVFIFTALSLPGLFHRQIAGWRYMYYAMLLLILSDIVTGDLPSIVMSAIGLWVAFQIRPLYSGIIPAAPQTPVQNQ